jgi:hypothetical protein
MEKQKSLAQRVENYLMTKTILPLDQVLDVKQIIEAELFEEGRPCSTDHFIRVLLDTYERDRDIVSSLDEWRDGNYDDAVFELTLFEPEEMFEYRVVSDMGKMMGEGVANAKQLDKIVSEWRSVANADRFTILTRPHHNFEKID